MTVSTRSTKTSPHRDLEREQEAEKSLKKVARGPKGDVDIDLAAPFSRTVTVHYSLPTPKPSPSREQVAVPLCVDIIDLVSDGEDQKKPTHETPRAIVKSPSLLNKRKWMEPTSTPSKRLRKDTESDLRNPLDAQCDPWRVSIAGVLLASGVRSEDSIGFVTRFMHEVPTRDYHDDLSISSILDMLRPLKLSPKQNLEIATNILCIKMGREPKYRSKFIGQFHKVFCSTEWMSMGSKNQELRLYLDHCRAYLGFVLHRGRLIALDKECREHFMQEGAAIFHLMNVLVNRK